ncbi:7610_t:CDS:1, partial [Paraglomus occultum]
SRSSRNRPSARSISKNFPRPNLQPTSTYKYDDFKRYKLELKQVKSQFLKETTEEPTPSTIPKTDPASDSVKSAISIKSQLDRTSDQLSLQNRQPFVSPEYPVIKRQRALVNYNEHTQKLREQRLRHCLYLYQSTTDFVTEKNLDSKIELAFSTPRRPFMESLADLQLDVVDSGGVIDEREAKRRLDRLRDVLDGTTHGGKYFGLDAVSVWANSEDGQRVGEERISVNAVDGISVERVMKGSDENGSDGEEARKSDVNVNDITVELDGVNDKATYLEMVDLNLREDSDENEKSASIANDLR